MDWNTILFAIRWAIIALFYFVLLVLLIGVYREASSRVGQKSGIETIIYGRLRVIQSGSDPRLSSGTILNLKTVTTLGAEGDNDIVLGDRFVSGHHLRFRWDGAVWWLEDLNSKNGTLVNRQPVEPERPQILLRGAMITAGDMVMELIE
jgi:pSer/pThr/pTyr-binding forkhead associated (FHA) protein